VAEDYDRRARGLAQPGSVRQLIAPAIHTAQGHLLVRIGVVAVCQQNTAAGNCHQLLQRESAFHALGLIVAVHRNHGRDATQVVQHAPLTDVAGMQDQVCAAQ